MTAHHQYIAALMAKRLQEELSEAEQQELQSALDKEPAYQALWIDLQEGRGVQEGLQAISTVDTETAFRRVSALLNEENAVVERPVHRVHFLKTAWFRYAAAVIILCGIGAYLWTSNKEQLPEPVAKTDIPPGRDGAVLTLADGKQLVLDSLGNGIVAEQNGTKIVLKNGQLAYNAGNGAATGYNTMTTPRGRQFSIQLPDGSRAWLNAASSITYPTAFIAEERTVTISGEVYFEIVKDAKKPFKVKVNDKNEIEVLGTSFNVKAYADDPAINTTLLEGAVRVNAFRHLQTLKPGQQVQVMPDGEMQLIKNADLQKVMAWKNGLFNFNDVSLPEVLKQLERWYDIDVKYAGDPPRQKFYGELQRNLSLTQVIEALQEIGIHFRIEGRTLIVMP